MGSPKDVSHQSMLGRVGHKSPTKSADRVEDRHTLFCCTRRISHLLSPSWGSQRTTLLRTGAKHIHGRGKAQPERPEKAANLLIFGLLAFIIGEIGRCVLADRALSE